MTSTLEWMGEGASLGTSIMPGIGTGIGAALGGLASLAVQLFPGLEAHLGGTQAAVVTAALAPAFEAVLGTSDPIAAAAALVADPNLGTQLRVQLAQLAADSAEAADKARIAVMASALADTQDARATMVKLASTGSHMAWGAPVVSIVVLVTFGVVVSLAISRAMPPGSEPILNMMLGTLGAMATTVVGYWMGSSNGSTDKSNLLANSVPADLLRGK